MVDVREVTEAEVLAFKRDGWVLLRELIPPPVAHEMRLRAEALMGLGTPDAARGGYRDVWRLCGM